MIPFCVIKTLKSGTLLLYQNHTIRVYDDEFCLPENRSMDDYAISVSWNVADVKGTAEEKGMKITTSQAIQVLDNMKRNHDAELGITWTTIDCWLDELEKIL